MTGVQALVAIALFAPGVLAPTLALSDKEVGAFATAVFAVGAFTSLHGGLLACRFGPFTVAAFCAFAVALSMATAALGSLPALIVAGMFGWNGIFFAEVARLAPSDRVAEATGAVLVASYTGATCAGPGRRRTCCGPHIVAELCRTGRSHGARHPDADWSAALIIF
jgi:hypothetical protein